MIAILSLCEYTEADLDMSLHICIYRMIQILRNPVWNSKPKTECSQYNKDKLRYLANLCGNIFIYFLTGFHRKDVYLCIRAIKCYSLDSMRNDFQRIYLVQNDMKMEICLHFHYFLIWLCKAESFRCDSLDVYYQGLNCLTFQLSWILGYNYFPKT